MRSAPGMPRASTATSPSTSCRSTGAVWSAAGRARSSSSRTRPSTRFASRAITCAYSFADPSASRASSSADPCRPASGFLISWARPAASASKSRARSDERGTRKTSTVPTQIASSTSGFASTEIGTLGSRGEGKSIDWVSCAMRARSESTASCSPPGSARTGSSMARSRLRPKSSSAAGFRCKTPPSAPTMTRASATESTAARASAAGSGEALPVRDKGCARLERVLAALAGPDADDLLDRHDEDLAVADPPRLRGALDRLDDPADDAVGDHHLHLHLGEEVDDVLGAAVELGVPLLAAEALHLPRGETRDSDLGESLLHVVQLERLDDRLDLLHGGAPSGNWNWTLNPVARGGQPFVLGSRAPPARDPTTPRSSLPGLPPAVPGES